MNKQKTERVSKSQRLCSEEDSLLFPFVSSSTQNMEWNKELFLGIREQKHTGFLTTSVVQDIIEGSVKPGDHFVRQSGSFLES